MGIGQVKMFELSSDFYEKALVKYSTRIQKQFDLSRLYCHIVSFFLDDSR